MCAQSITHTANYVMNFYGRRIVRDKCSDKKLRERDNWLASRRAGNERNAARSMPNALKLYES